MPWWRSGAPKAPSVFDAPQPVGATATCPVLGNQFTITADTLHSEYQGKHVYFCCAGCKDEFEKAPDKYLAKLPQFQKQEDSR